MSVYLITGASSDVGTALIDRLYREGDVFIAQGAGDLSHLAPTTSAQGHRTAPVPNTGIKSNSAIRKAIRKE